MSLSQPLDENESWLLWFENFKAWDRDRDRGGWAPSLGYKTPGTRPPHFGTPERVTFVERCRICRKVAARYTAPDDLREGGWQWRPCACDEPAVVLPAGRALERRVARSRGERS